MMTTQSTCFVDVSVVDERTVPGTHTDAVLTHDSKQTHPQIQLDGTPADRPTGASVLP